MINISTFSKEIKSHVKKIKSSSFVCSTKASFESWFKVELIQVLYDMGYTRSQIKTKFNYPRKKNIADIAINDQNGKIVFELKPFVIKQDSNKKEEYPKQIARLENLSNEKDTQQVITFTTYIGYSNEQMLKLIEMLFNKNLWEIIGPEKLISEYELYFTVTGIPKDSNSNTQFKNLNNAITQKKMKNEITKMKKNKNIERKTLSKYYPLYEKLRSYEIKLTFEKIEDIINDNLPAAATKYAAWWSGDRPQVNFIKDAGWEIIDVDLENKHILLRKKT